MRFNSAGNKYYKYFSPERALALALDRQRDLKDGSDGEKLLRPRLSCGRENPAITKCGLKLITAPSGIEMQRDAVRGAVRAEITRPRGMQQCSKECIILPLLTPYLPPSTPVGSVHSYYRSTMPDGSNRDTVQLARVNRNGDREMSYSNSSYLRFGTRCLIFRVIVRK